MKHILNRNEFIQNMNEGFFKDKIKAGIDKVKSLFKVGMLKVKNFIAMFDSNGKLFPVITIHSIIDRFANTEGVKVYTSQSIIDAVTEAGGDVGDVSTKAPVMESHIEFNEEEFDNAFDDFDDIEKTNFKSLVEFLSNTYGDIVNETYDEIVKNRISYKGDMGNKVKEIDYDEFRDLLGEYIDERCVNQGVLEDGIDPMPNILVFGAPGIGKSTVPNDVIAEYNKQEHIKNDPSKMLSLIVISCGILQPGDFMMPTMPKEVDIMRSIRDFKQAFPQANEYIDSLSDTEKKDLAHALTGSAQFKATDAPKSWLPSYRKVGGQIDKLLDAYANGGVYKISEGNSVATGGGGIILFDELLRAHPDVFNSMMNFLFDRELNGWVLGSRWTIIACSNRPCDDNTVEDVWTEWQQSPPQRDRWGIVVQLVPDPKKWITWARSKKVNADETLLSYIFDNRSKVGNEYPRWHSTVRGGSGEGEQVKPLTPRRWRTAFSQVNRLKKRFNTNSIFEIPESKLKDRLELVFDKDIVIDILDWLKDNRFYIDLEQIIEVPDKVRIPEEVDKDEANAFRVLDDLGKQFEKKFKSHPEKCTDEIVRKIIIWLGIQFKERANVVYSTFVNQIESVLDPKSEKGGWPKLLPETVLMIESAWPPSDMKQDIKDFIDRGMYKDVDECMEKIKENIRQYFPWRMDGDEIKYFDKLDV